MSYRFITVLSCPLALLFACGEQELKELREPTLDTADSNQPTDEPAGEPSEPSGEPSEPAGEPSEPAGEPAGEPGIDQILEGDLFITEVMKAPSTEDNGEWFELYNSTAEAFLAGVHGGDIAALGDCPNLHPVGFSGCTGIAGIVGHSSVRLSTF